MKICTTTKVLRTQEANAALFRGCSKWLTVQISLKQLKQESCQSRLNKFTPSQSETMLIASFFAKHKTESERGGEVWTAALKA